MKTIKSYKCECGEEFYEDDEECCNCGAPVDQKKFKTESVYKITHVVDGETTEEDLI